MVAAGRSFIAHWCHPCTRRFQIPTGKYFSGKLYFVLGVLSHQLTHLANLADEARFYHACLLCPKKGQNEIKQTSVF